jgi:hypothetical protein
LRLDLVRLDLVRLDLVRLDLVRFGLAQSMVPPAMSGGAVACDVACSCPSGVGVSEG